MNWDPGAYNRFRGPRLRPALDLMRALPELPAEGDVVDLGCGAGDAAEALVQSLCAGGRRLIGVDTSERMLARAAATRQYSALTCADMVTWTPESAPALLFSNAALQWAADHRALLPRLVRALRPGGVLAVQVPYQTAAPSHQLWLSLAAKRFPGRVDPDSLPDAMTPADYRAIGAPLGAVDLWETSYYQHLPPAEDGHPVRLFTQSTFAKPILAVLDQQEQDALIDAYEMSIGAAYGKDAEGGVLFPFRRLFFTIKRED